MKVRMAAAALVITLLVPAARGNALAAAISPQQLGLGASAYPAGAVITLSHVDKTAAAVSAEGIRGSKDTHGTLYQKLHFSGSIFQQALLPRFNGYGRHVWLMATVFPTTDAANQAYGVDSNFDTQCGASPTAAVSIPTQTCAYVNVDGHESGTYAVGVEGDIEFIVLGFVEMAGSTARDRSIRDAMYVTTQESEHIAHLLAPPSQGAAQPVPTKPAPMATAAPASSPAPVPTANNVIHGVKPVSSNKRCPDVLHNQGWSKVSLRPDLYIKCVVDIAAYVASTQTLDNAVSYNANLNPDVGPNWFIFAYDYSNNPPSIPDNSWVRIHGTIEASLPGYNSAGSFVSNEPEIKVAQLVSISAALAKKLGGDAIK